MSTDGGSPLTVLRGGEDWIAIDKPAGALVIPGRGEGEAPVLLPRLEAQLGGGKLFVVHRLDRDTSGVLLFARNAHAHRSLSMAFEAGKIRKRYQAIVHGRVEAPLDLQVALVPARRGRMRAARPGEEGKATRTLIRPLEALRDATRVEAEPLTGRTHQIRVHLLSAGHPLIVDHQYGLRGGEPLVPGLLRTPLHAAWLEVPALDGVAPAVVEAPLPADLEQALAVLRG